MRLIGAIIVLLAIGCSREPDYRSPETIQMAKYLELKADSAKRSIAFPYFNDYLIKRISYMLRGLPYHVKSGQRLDYGLALLMKGENELCIEEMKKCIKSFPDSEKVNDKNVYFYKVLALAYLRQAEQTNCIDHHSSTSCVIPLDGNGIHQDKSWANKAAEVYRNLMVYDSLDDQSKWFLNLAHMALGNYPDGVPERYVINPALFQSGHSFKPFRNVAMSAGVAINNHAGASVSEDFNNDGLIDLFTTSYSLAEQSYLLTNQGNGKFSDESSRLGLLGLTAGLNAVQGDFNNDGYEDLFVGRGAWLGKNGQIRNSLLINNAGNGFEERSYSANLPSEKPTGTVAIADIDLDGDLDIFIGNEGTLRTPFPSELMLNDGTGKFEDASDRAGLAINEFVKGASWGDVNNDGYPDLVVSIYGGNNKLFINRSKDGKVMFEESGKMAGISEPIYSFPCWFWDFDNDGFQDIMIFGYDNRQSQLIPSHVLRNMENNEDAKDKPRLYKNNGDETFSDITTEAGLDIPIYAMGANYGDLNNDGYPDFYTGTGEFNLWAQIPNRMFLNIEGNRFVEVTYEGGFGQIQKGHGISFADFDNDGDQDIYHQVGGAAESDVFHNMLFENPGFENNWISIDLEGAVSNRSAIGATLKLSILDERTNERRIVYHHVNSGGSFGANSLRAEIGLGITGNIDTLSITWPNGEQEMQVFYNIEPNQHYTLRESEPLKLVQRKKFSFSEIQSTHHHAALAEYCGK